MKKIFAFIFLSFLLTGCQATSADNQHTQSADNQHTHTFASDWSYDSTYHWHSSTCGHDVVSGKSLHTFSNTIVQPTYTSEGYTKHTCTTCGYYYIDNQTAALTHNYSTTWSYDSTSHWHACTDSGYTHLYKDKENHNFYYQKVINPTFSSQGYTEHYCSKCSYVHKDNYTPSLAGTVNLNVELPCTLKTYNEFSGAIHATYSLNSVEYTPDVSSSGTGYLRIKLHLTLLTSGSGSSSGGWNMYFTYKIYEEGNESEVLDSYERNIGHSSNYSIGESWTYTISTFNSSNYYSMSKRYLIKVLNVM